MTSISSISSARVYVSPGRNERVDPLTRVADALDLSYGTLKDQLDLGRGLFEIAAAQGVPQDKLIAAASAAGLPGTATVAAPERTDPSRGENAGLRDHAKLAQLGELLGMATADFNKRAASPSELVTLLRDRGVNLSELRGVLDSGDLLDVLA